MTEVGIGLDVGDINSHKIIMPYILHLRNLFSDGVQLTPEVEKISIVFRADGQFASFGFQGCDKVKFLSKKKNISLDIGLKISDLESNDLNSLIEKYINEAGSKIIDLLHKKKIKISEEIFLESFSKVIDKL